VDVSEHVKIADLPIIKIGMKQLGNEGFVGVVPHTRANPSSLVARAICPASKKSPQILSSTGMSSGFTPASDSPLTNHSRIWPMPRL
jgi:hypothetical protein